MKNTFLFVFILTIFNSLAQQSIACKEDLFPVRDKEKKQYGYVNIFGAWKIPAFYDQARNFKEGIAVVNRKSKFGIISCEGKVILTCEYDEIQDFVNGYSWIKKNELWGMIDTKGTIILACNYTKVENISSFNDLAWIQTNNKWGIFDKTTQKFIHNPQYDSYLQVSENTSLVELNGKKGMISHFKEEKLLETSSDSIIKFAPYLLSYHQNEKIGVIKDNGLKLLKPEFDEVKHLGSTLFSVKKNGFWGVWDTWGNQLVPIVLDSVGVFSNNAAVYKKDGAYGFINTKGQAFEEKYEFANSFINGIALVKQKNRYFLINRKADVISQSFDQIKLFSEYFIGKEDLDDLWGIYTYENPQNSTNTFNRVLGGKCEKIKVVTKEKTWFYNAKTQNFASTLSFDSIGEWQKTKLPEELFAIVKENGMYGIIDTNLKITTPTIYEKIRLYTTFQNSFFIGEKQNLEYLFTTKGKEILANYTKIIPVNKNTFIVKKDSKCGVLNDKNEEIILFKFDNLTSENRESSEFCFPIVADINGKYGLINQKGETLIDFKHDRIDYIGNGFFGLTKKEKQFIVDSKGLLVHEKLPYTVVSSLTNDLFLISKNNTFGIINRKNEVKAEPIYTTIYPFYGNYCVVEKEGKYGILTKNGQLKHQLIYEKVKVIDTKIILSTGNTKVELSKEGNITE